MNYIFSKDISPFSEYILTADEFEEIMVESSSQDVIVCSNCFAVIDSENASDQKLTWAMDSITLKRKIKSSDGRIQVEFEKSDSDGTNLIIVPSESFTKNKLDSLSKYGIYCSHSDDIKVKLSSYFIANLNELPVEPEIQNIGFCLDSDGSLGFLGYDKDDPITLEINNSFSSEKQYFKKISKLIKDSAPLQYAISVSVASALLAYISMVYNISVKSFVVNWVGKSSTGKTTAQELCASMFSSIDDQNVFSPFFGTENAILKSMNVTGVPKIFDESTSLANFNRENFIYSVSNETEKKRLTQSLTLKERCCWKTIPIISSEENFVDLNQNKRNGIAVRLHCIHGLKFTNSREHAEEIHSFCTQNYGIVGFNIVNMLMEEEGGIESDYNQWRKYLRNCIGYDSFSLTERLINEYALILLSAELLESLGVTVDKSAIADILLEHHSETARDTDIAKNAYKSLMSYVARNPYNSGIKVMSDNHETAIEESLFKEILKKNQFYDIKTVVNELDSLGYTKRREKNRKKVKLSLNGSSCYCYLLDTSRLEGEEYTGVIVEEADDEIISYDNETVHFDEEVDV